jgi:hypothetical protein
MPCERINQAERGPHSVSRETPSEAIAPREVSRGATLRYALNMQGCDRGKITERRSLGARREPRTP